MKLQDIINADFANVIHEYKDIELQEFTNGTLTIECINGIQASNLVRDLQDTGLGLDMTIYTKFWSNQDLVHYIDIK